MHVPKFISQIPVQFNHAFHSVSVKGSNAKKGAVNFLKSRGDHFAQSDFWKNYGKPLYERNIEPLKKGDYLFLAGMTCVAAAVVIVAIKIFTIAAFPLALGCASLIFMGTCSYLSNQTRQHFDDLAWDRVDEIRKLADKTTPNNQNFGDISAERAHLSKPVFNHLKDDLKQLDEEIRAFKSAVISSNYEDKKKIIKTHLTLLKSIVQAHAQDLACIQALEKEIDKSGQKNQDFTALESQKQKLHDLQTAPARDHIADMQKQVNALVKALQGPNLADSKKAFIEYAEGLQRKLASHKKITDLSTDEFEADDLDDKTKNLNAKNPKNKLNAKKDDVDPDVAIEDDIE